MIEQKRRLLADRSVFEQIIEHHEISYKDLAKKLELNDRSLRRIRSGDTRLKMSMRQVKTLCELLEPFDVRFQDLPEDWMVEGKSVVTH
ncbi:MAG: helix-turn-helix domain-containing protein [Crocosphaera sp.]|nr:helix-turn-helix domain-containing protein [Crocosphaera sp.]